MTKVLAALALLLFTGCAGINGSQPVFSLKVLADDFQAAADNFTQAGMATEAKCMADAAAKVGKAPASYKVVGIFSGASVAYITYDQVNNTLASGPNALTPECQAVVGKIMLAAASKGAQPFGL